MKIHKIVYRSLIVASFVSCLALGVIGANADATSQTNQSTSDQTATNVTVTQPKPKRTKRVVNQENMNGTTTSIPRKDVVVNHDYDFYYNMRPFPTQEQTLRGNSKVTFNHPWYLHYAMHTHYKFGRPFGDPQSMTILPDGRLYILFNAGHGDSHKNRILEYNAKNRKLLKVGDIFNGGHGQGLSYDYQSHKLLLCVNHFIAHHHGLLKGDLLITRVGKRTLKPFGKIMHVKAPKNMNLGDDFTTDANGNFYNVSKYGDYSPYSPYGGLLIYRGNQSRMKLIKLLFHSPSSTIQNIEYNPTTKRIYTVGNACITSFPVKRLNHLKSRDVRVSIFNNPVEFESLAFYKNRAYLLLDRPSRILVSNRLF